ncbi:MAG: metallophosphatase family protein [Acidobacteriota bacterium]|nr:metallophosphatase family protein [Acidobacteriota bacterium]
MSHPAVRSFNIGVISDTHGLLRPEAVEALRGVDHILHAGDVGDARILSALREIAPLTAIRGNVDVSGECGQLPPTDAVELGGCLIYLIHALADLDINPRAAGVGAVVYGHSHRPDIQQRDGVLYLNPGSAGSRRFSLPVTLAKVEVAGGKFQARIVGLGDNRSHSERG